MDAVERRIMRLALRLRAGWLRFVIVRDFVAEILSRISVRYWRWRVSRVRGKLPVGTRPGAAHPWQLACSYCNRPGPVRDTAKEAVVAALDAGWVTQRAGDTWRCFHPKCAIEFESGVETR